MSAEGCVHLGWCREFPHVACWQRGKEREGDFNLQPLNRLACHHQIVESNSSLLLSYLHVANTVWRYRASSKIWWLCVCVCVRERERERVRERKREQQSCYRYDYSSLCQEIMLSLKSEETINNIACNYTISLRNRAKIPHSMWMVLRWWRHFTTST
jgi:hypothetical protein